ncbi:MAG: undecaprenyl-diphosphate phosphatase [Patescibacteria group bacterium]
MSHDILTALVLGLIEGVTEFLPISSTGHLIVAGDLLGFTGDRAKTFEIFIQLGAILSVVWVFWKKIFDFFGFSGGAARVQSLHFWTKIFVAFVPSAVFGLLFHKWIKAILFQPLVVACALIVGGVLIFVIEHFAKKGMTDSVEKVSMRQSFKIGLCQVLALIPGVSRSGATILGGMSFGLNRVAATEFSFFLAIPTMLAATLYDLLKSASVLSMSDAPMFAVGFLTSFISALVVIKLFLKFVSTHTFRSFAWYRIGFGLLVLALAVKF